MGKCIKERVYQALKNKNYFDYGKKDSLEVLENAENLEDVLIQVERGCNVDRIVFRYNPATRKFHRVMLTEEDKRLLERESKGIHHDKCIKRKCFKKEIDIDSFIKLLEYSFEPLAVVNVNEANI